MYSFFNYSYLSVVLISPGQKMSTHAAPRTWLHMPLTQATLGTESSSRTYENVVCHLYVAVSPPNQYNTARSQGRLTHTASWIFHSLHGRETNKKWRSGTGSQQDLWRAIQKLFGRLWTGLCSGCTPWTPLWAAVCECRSSCGVQAGLSSGSHYLVNQSDQSHSRHHCTHWAESE